MGTLALCGLSGSITSASGTEITEWNIDLVVDALDATSMASSGWKEKITCIKGGSGNFICIGSKPTIGSHAGCSFVDAAVGGSTISGDIFINDIGVTTPVAEKVAWDAKFVFTGTITAAGAI
jgi:hypothetical protein